MAGSSSNIPAVNDANWEMEVYEWPEVITEEIKKEIKSSKQRYLSYLDKKGDLYTEEGKFLRVIDENQEWVDNAKEKIKQKEEWIANTKRKIVKKEKIIWDTKCDKYMVIDKHVDLDESIEADSDFLDEARNHFPNEFKI